MQIRPGDRVRAMQRLRKAIEDAGDFGTVVVMAERASGGKSIVYHMVTGQDGGSEASAYTMLNTVPSEMMDSIYPPVESVDDETEPEFEEDPDDEDEAGA